MKALHKFMYSEEVLELAKSCQNFCKWIESTDETDAKSFATEGLKLLPGIYSKMISIPDFDPVFDESADKFVSEEEWSRIYQKVSTVLGAMNEYNDFAAKDEFDRTEITLRTISEDIADIYQDIKDFLEIFRNSPEEIMNDSLWECKANFTSSWGEKLLRVSKAMHAIYLSDDPSDETGTNNTKKQRDTSNWFITKRQQEFGNEDEIISE